MKPPSKKRAAASKPTRQTGGTPAPKSRIPPSGTGERERLGQSRRQVGLVVLETPITAKSFAAATGISVKGILSRLVKSLERFPTSFTVLTEEQARHLALELGIEVRIENGQAVGSQLRGESAFHSDKSGRKGAPVKDEGSFVVTDAADGDFPGEGWSEGKLISIADRTSQVVTD